MKAFEQRLANPGYNYFNARDMLVHPAEFLPADPDLSGTPDFSESDSASSPDESDPQGKKHAGNSIH